MNRKNQFLSTLSFICLVFLFMSCSSSKVASNASASGKASKEPILKDETTFLLESISKDKTYGYTEKNPIKVGNSGGSGPANERRFLNALTGPNGEAIQYVRLGSCCAFNTPKGFMGKGLLDRYKVTWEGQTEETVLYDYEPLSAPVGFKIK